MPSNQQQGKQQTIAELDPQGHEFRERHTIGKNNSGPDKRRNQNADVKHLREMLRK
jgi:hypothetical protein